ncbi:hypothetical protein IJD44_02175 [bacterium]|nr:hypothetical protein [bacterium]
MDILKTFEIFLSAPLSVIHRRKIKIMHIETNIFVPKLPIDVDINDDIELTVYNNPKVYRLLSAVIQKRRMKNENKDSKIYNERTVS